MKSAAVCKYCKVCFNYEAKNNKSRTFCSRVCFYEYIRDINRPSQLGSHIQQLVQKVCGMPVSLRIISVIIFLYLFSARPLVMVTASVVVTILFILFLFDRS